MAFDLGEMLKSVSESDTGREQIEYIRLDLLDSDEKNFYELSEIPALADNIATVGLQQPLRVRKHPTEEGKYIIVSGHRRRAALELLAKDEPERWAEVPCIVQREAVSPALQQLQLIYANSGTRKLSSSDMNEQAAQVEKLLYQLQQEGHEFPGRMRDHVAKVMQTTNTKLATLKKIREHLAECWQPRYKKGKLPENTAYEIAKIPPDAQQILFDIRMKNDPNLGSFWAEDAKAFAKTCKGIEKLKCNRRGRPSDCLNADNKKKRAAALHYYQTCHCTKCCGDCPDLINCKYACPVLADKVKQMKADRKEANRQAKLDQEEKDRPTIELLQRLWLRFAYAREQAGVSIQDTCKAADYYYSASAEKDITELENCTAKFSANNTDVPYGYRYHLSYIRALCAMADLFGCSVDYLLSRTDIKDMAGSASAAEAPETSAPTQVEFIPGNWYPASVEPPVGTEIILIDRWNFVDQSVYLGSGQFSEETTSPWCDIVLWSPMPKEVTATELSELSDDCYPSLEWIPGHDLPAKPLRAIAQFDLDDGQHPVELLVHWRPGGWHSRNGQVVEGSCIRWFPLPPDDDSSNSALNHSCKTGMSPTGQCGAAAYCEEPVDCCLNCDKNSNLRCGHLEG